MSKPIVLHLGDDIKWNHDLYKSFTSHFEIKRSHSMSRPDFINALKQKTFGDFFAIYRPFWNTGGEMGNWDDELISLLPASCKIYASAGAGFDWVDTAALAKRGTFTTPLLELQLLMRLFRRHVLQRSSCLHRIRSRRSNLAHHLRLPQPQLVQHSSPLRRQGQIHRRQQESGPCIPQPRRLHPRNHWFRAHRSPHR